MLNDDTTTPSDVNTSIPVIDFSLFKSDPVECARHVLEASQNIGFFYLKNHGVSQDLIAEMFDASESYFNQPIKIKAQCMVGTDNVGYTSMKSEKLNPDNHEVGDLKEAFQIHRLSVDEKDPVGHFSQGDEELQFKVGQFFQGLDNMSRKVMECFAIGLQVPESAGGRHYFNKTHTWDENSQSTLRFLHYPSQPGDPHSPLAGSHTDYGSMTLLIQKDIPGLEVQASRTHKNVPWVPAPVIPNTILVNIADHLQMWTNGLLKSTMHRVMYNLQQKNRSRYSIACFINADIDMKLDPIPTPLITQEMRAEATEFEEARNMTAGEYLNWRLKRSYDYAPQLDEDS
ncbi:hypothetical protein EMPS_11460 [Entomortierella parvispora]|uniref:Fe2OG dioxygenase domain-containing protein n=1 Tax=Entomortierella parvispora TaxID=205924 RepID=A0A9P3HM56_9FUNG|nr:hypothetical protein EMPS_11460 [Entomortierella parvispora]